MASILFGAGAKKKIECRLHASAFKNNVTSTRITASRAAEA